MSADPNSEDIGQGRIWNDDMEEFFKKQYPLPHKSKKNNTPPDPPPPARDATPKVNDPPIEETPPPRPNPLPQDPKPIDRGLSHPRSIKWLCKLGIAITLSLASIWHMTQLLGPISTLMSHASALFLGIASMSFTSVPEVTYPPPRLIPRPFPYIDSWVPVIEHLNAEYSIAATVLPELELTVDKKFPMRDIRALQIFLGEGRHEVSSAVSNSRIEVTRLTDLLKKAPSSRLLSQDFSAWDRVQHWLFGNPATRELIDRSHQLQSAVLPALSAMKRFLAADRKHNLAVLKTRICSIGPTFRSISHLIIHPTILQNLDDFLDWSREKAVIAGGQCSVVQLDLWEFADLCRVMETNVNSMEPLVGDLRHDVRRLKRRKDGVSEAEVLGYEKKLVNIAECWLNATEKLYLAEEGVNHLKMKVN